MQEIEVHIDAKALIFDIDGTLADSMPIHYIAWKNTTERYGISFSEQQFYNWAGVPAPTIVQWLLKKEIIDAEVVHIAEEKENHYQELIHLIKPLQPVINIAHKYYGVLPLSAGTGSPSIIARKTLEALKIAHCFQAVVSYEDVVNPKPAPDTFIRCANLMNVDPKYCQVFEDGEPGLVAARAAGMIATDIRPFL
jgi:beta-phosphoglucomutase family hydrolase